MVIKKLKDVPYADLEGYENVDKQIVIGPDDGSEEIVMRYFTLSPGGMSPYHSHDFPHLVKVEAGCGAVKNEAGSEKELETGDYIYVNENEKHQFRNTGSDIFAFVCIVPGRGEK